MKYLTLTIGGILLVSNILFGFLLSTFEPFNVVFSSTAIVFTTLFIWLLKTVKMKDGFIVSLPFMFLSCGIVEYILGILSQPEIQDNGYIIASIVLIVIQAAVFLICNKLSKSV